MSRNTNTNQRRTRRNRGNPSTQSVRKDTALVLRREFPGQPVCTHIIQGTPLPLTSTVTTGVVAQVVNIAAASIPNFATRFACYESFRIVKATATVNSFGSTIPGVYKMWLDEDTSGAPSAAQALQTEVKPHSVSSTSRKSLTYTPHDPQQQNFQQVAVGPNAYGYFKLYTDTANFGSPIVATPMFLVEISFTVQFRGFA